MLQDRQFHNDELIDLGPGSNHLEYMRMGDGLQVGQLARVVEHHSSESGPIDLPVTDHVWPPFRHGVKSRTIGLENLVADAVGVDGLNPRGLQYLPNLTLARGETPTEDPAMIYGSHAVRQ